jgi:hypothetical protein
LTLLKKWVNLLMLKKSLMSTITSTETTTTNDTWHS